MSVITAEISVELTGRDGVTTFNADPDLVRRVVYKEIYLKILNHLSLAGTELER
jgi:hypothetical protein